MDFIENIGERYLIGKANAAPAMLENLARKKFTSAPDKAVAANQATTTLPSAEKDREIAKLRKQLAETRLEKGGKGGSVAGSVSGRSEHGGRRGDGGAVKAKEKEKEIGKKGLVPLSIDALRASQSQSQSHSHSSPKPKQRQTSPISRGRRASISTATAAKPHHNPAPSETKSVAPASRYGGSIQGLEALGATKALANEKEDGSRKLTASVSASSVRSSKSATRQSEIGSVVGSSKGGRSHPPASVSGSMVARPHPPASTSHSAITKRPMPAPSHGIHGVHRVENRTEPVSLIEVKSSPIDHEVHEPETYVVEVEEDIPRRREGGRGKRRDGDGRGGRGVVEVLSKGGRTVYRIG